MSAAGTTSSYRQQAPVPLNGADTVDSDYDYRAANSNTGGVPPTPTPTSASAQGWNQVQSYKAVATEGKNNEAADGEEALLDLVQLEELHQEAERMKALGNKHMAAQEFTRAYNAYSAALQLSPVGPSSHVFLSNRAAALLSLKRYAAAATDAKRAVALAPTFGKAHARLGQALYFQKDYAGAVKAYEDAIQYEPDNNVTQTYLEKAKVKLEKQTRKARGEEVSVADTTQFTAPASVVTDVNRVHGVVQSGGYRGNSEAVVQAATRKPSPYGPSTPLSNVGSPTSQLSSPLHTLSDLDLEDDPDFEEALKIQQRANRYLANKAYKYAIEEYTAALFLVPDDPQLSPDLHLGRAHALNGSRRHESARNDAMLAIRLNPTPAAYSTLAKSLFYMKDYQASIDAFGECMKVLPQGESLGMFDKAYLQKAEAALEEQSASLSIDNRTKASSKASAPVPKLPPPRFVPREEAMQQTHNLPSMPKQWPQQIPSSPSALRCGPEREVIFLSESLGIKLNRGPDGIVRVLSVTPHTAGSPVARDGAIHVGDVIREAAGVDIRRPITNVMWGDTVALIKMAPRPITMVVAQELSEVPTSVVEEQKRTQTPSKSATSSPANFRPSPANGDESVGQVSTTPGAIAAADDAAIHVENVTRESEAVIEEASNVAMDIPVKNTDGGDAPIKPISETGGTVNALADDISEVNIDDFLPPDELKDPNVDPITGLNEAPTEEILASEEEYVVKAVDNEPVDPVTSSQGKEAEGTLGALQQETSVETCVVGDEEAVDDGAGTEPLEQSTRSEETKEIENPVPESASERDVSRLEESRVVGGDVIFDGSPPIYNGWDNLRWMSYSGVRRLKLFQPVFRFRETKQTTLFWSKVEKGYVPRVLAIYEEPSLLLVLRRPAGLEEVTRLTGSVDPGEEYKNWIVESVVEPATCKLQLSNLTHRTSRVPVDEPDERARSLFEIISPAEVVRLSAVKKRDDAEKRERSFTDSGAFFETTNVENSLTDVIWKAHGGDGDVADRLLLRHQVILGTLHSYVLSGNVKALNEALERARRSGHSTKPEDSGGVSPRILDTLDDMERPAIFYACSRRMSSAVAALVSTGADVSYRTPDKGMTLVHICASNLDNEALAVLLKTGKADPNALDSLGRTPMCVAVMNGRSGSGQMDAVLLGRCIEALKSKGGQLMIDLPRWTQHPLSRLASTFRSQELFSVLPHVIFRFPLKNSDGLVVDNSLASFYDYPIHSALIAFVEFIRSLKEGPSLADAKGLPMTVRALLDFGFEPNERLDDSKFARDGKLALIGYAPIQLLALAALELEDVGPKVGEQVYGDLDSIVSATARTLVGSGARSSLEVPPGQRTKTNGGVDLGQEEENLRASLKIDTNVRLLHLLGGSDLLSGAKKDWTNKAKVDAGPQVTIQRDNSIVLENSDEPGGTNDKSCAICWKPFGLLVRKHKCRVSWRYVCDDCSTKRIVRGGKEHRVSDGQFLLASSDLARIASARLQRETQRKQQTKSAAVAKLEKLETEEANRNTLFGGALEQAASFVFGEQEEETASRTSQGLGGLAASMGETRNALLERGEKLSSLEDKSAKMVDASANFASMAKELRKKSEQGLFW